MIIYHPPYSSTHTITNANVIDNFTDFLTDLLSNNPNNMVLGDFNRHVNDDDTEANIFTDTATTLGLQQHITYATHRSGNILDLFLTKIEGNTEVLTSAPGTFISDHRAVDVTIGYRKPKLSKVITIVRKIKNISDDQWCSNLMQITSISTLIWNLLSCNFPMR